MYICVTEVDVVTKIPCTVEPQRTGPSMPQVKGLNIQWNESSKWPITMSPEGIYLSAPKYYGTCDDDADISIPGVLEVLTEQEFLDRKAAEIEARRPYPSWIWNDSSQTYVAPVERPANAIINGGDVAYRWSEEDINWVPIEYVPINWDPPVTE